MNAGEGSRKLERVAHAGGESQMLGKDVNTQGGGDTSGGDLGGWRHEWEGSCR